MQLFVQQARLFVRLQKGQVLGEQGGIVTLRADAIAERLLVGQLGRVGGVQHAVVMVEIALTDGALRAEVLNVLQ